jgi:hypothetical protein
MYYEASEYWSEEVWIQWFWSVRHSGL